MSRGRSVLSVGLALLVGAGVLVVGSAPAAADPFTALHWGPVSTGGNHTCGVRSNGTLWCWGSNSQGQLGLGDRVDRWVPVQVQPGTRWYTVYAGYRHTCAVRTDHTLWCWGGNEFGQLGIGPVAVATVPTQVPGLWAMAETSYFHTCGIKPIRDIHETTGELWCWGWNGEGQLGTGDRTSSNVPRRVDLNVWTYAHTGYAHTCGLRPAGTLYCWGRGDHGQLGTGGTADRLTPHPVGSPITDLYAGFATGADHTCGLRHPYPYTLYCWGRNHQGQLGIGTYASKTIPTVVPAPPGEFFRSVTATDSHTCGLALESHTAWCWGWNAYGQLGNGSTTTSPSPRRVLVDIPFWIIPGVAHTCTVRVDETLWCWGKNTYGQLGLGDTVDRTLPTVLGPDPSLPPPTP